MREEVSNKILRTVSREKAFYFFTSIGNYTGESAASLKEFAERIDQVNLKSLEFHLYRGDFERWASQVLEDEGLVVEIKKLQRTGLVGDSLRGQLRTITSRRHQELSNRSLSERFHMKPV